MSIKKFKELMNNASMILHQREKVHMFCEILLVILKDGQVSYRQYRKYINNLMCWIKQLQTTMPLWQDPLFNINLLMFQVDSPLLTKNQINLPLFSSLTNSLTNSDKISEDEDIDTILKKEEEV